jgi:hypothetical protein
MSLKKKVSYTPFGGRISKHVKNHLNDPHVVEMGRRAQEMLKKVGFPEDLLGKNKPR